MLSKTVSLPKQLNRLGSPAQDRASFQVFARAVQPLTLPRVQPHGFRVEILLRELKVPAILSMHAVRCFSPQAKMEVFFTLLAECYGRRSVPITSNLVSSKWGPVSSRIR